MAEGRATLLYDGDCGLCRRWVARLERRDARGLLETIPFQDPGVSSRFPALSREALEREVHLVLPGGRVERGAAALPHVLRRLPRWRRVAWVVELPGISALAGAVYRAVARNRGRLGGGGRCATGR
ncbi:MAG TPA: DUF393 domain-containing protein [Candidatus Polarisedimenticolia bacterium]|nr:DUF393 domain-containing protein [Candidatus Polarisedimenticolia bacterium]